MAKNVYQFVDVERIDPPKKPITVRKGEFAEIYQPLSQSQTEGQADRCLDCGNPNSKGHPAYFTEVKGLAPVPPS